MVRVHQMQFASAMVVSNYQSTKPNIIQKINRLNIWGELKYIFSLFDLNIVFNHCS